MKIFSNLDLSFHIPILLLLVLGTTILVSVKPDLFPVQIFYIVLALIGFFIATRTDKIVLESLSPIFYGITLFLLLGTLLLGVLSHGAIRWLPIGPITLQPSEFAKPVIVLATAWILSRNFKHSFIVSFFNSLTAAFLVFIQPDLGTTVIIFLAWFGSVLGAGISIKTLFRFSLFCAIALPLMWFILAPYQKERVLSFLTPQPQGASYQSIQSTIAVGSGGLFGRGLGQGSQTQLAFLPARHTDFVFASIGEELGFFGAMLVIVLFFILFWKLLSIFGQKKDGFSKSVIGGIFFYLFAQTFVNIAMNLGILPVAGIPLPLISAGGSALVSTMLALGIVVALRR